MPELTDFATLANAQAYTQTISRPITRNVMNLLLAGAGIYVAFKKMAEDDAHPFQNIAAAFLDATEYTFTPGTTNGDANIATLDAMIGASLPESPALAALRPTVIALSQETVQPFAPATEHVWYLANGTMPLKAVAPVNGFVKITLSRDVELHHPRVMGYEAALDVYYQAGVFHNVKKAGPYVLKLKSSFPALFVDDPYGAIQ